MTPREFCIVMAQLGLNPPELARILKVGRRTPFRWAAGDAPISHSIELVLRYWLKTGIAPHEL
jgi:hypothetical protein